MKIRRLSVRNFRLIRELELECRDLMPRLGGGYRCPSSLLGAVEFALRAGSEARREDFCPFRDPGDDDMSVELVVADLTEREHAELGPYVAPDGTITVRKTASLRADGTAQACYAV